MPEQTDVVVTVQVLDVVVTVVTVVRVVTEETADVVVVVVVAYVTVNVERKDAERCTFSDDDKSLWLASM